MMKNDDLNRNSNHSSRQSYYSQHNYQNSNKNRKSNTSRNSTNYSPNSTSHNRSPIEQFRIEEKRILENNDTSKFFEKLNQNKTFNNNNYNNHNYNHNNNNNKIINNQSCSIDKCHCACCSKCPFYHQHKRQSNYSPSCLHCICPLQTTTRNLNLNLNLTQNSKSITRSKSMKTSSFLEQPSMLKEDSFLPLLRERRKANEREFRQNFQRPPLPPSKVSQTHSPQPSNRKQYQQNYTIKPSQYAYQRSNQNLNENININKRINPQTKQRKGIYSLNHNVNEENFNDKYHYYQRQNDDYYRNITPLTNDSIVNNYSQNEDSLQLNNSNKSWNNSELNNFLDNVIENFRRKHSHLLVSYVKERQNYYQNQQQQQNYQYYEDNDDQNSNTDQNNNTTLNENKIPNNTFDLNTDENDTTFVDVVSPNETLVSQIKQEEDEGEVDLGEETYNRINTIQNTNMSANDSSLEFINYTHSYVIDEDNPSDHSF
jgi:hypothetical protein